MSAKPPVISKSELDQPDVLAKLDLACREWGVFYLTDHGLEGLDELFHQTQAFFAQPLEKKREVRRTRENAWGYFDEELTKNARDWKEIFDFGPSRGDFVAQWPAGHPALRRACEAYYAACEGISFDLLAAISANLGVGGSFLCHAFEPDHDSFVRLNYYPNCPAPAAPSGLAVPENGYLGVNHHTDAGALTLLLTDEHPGLEVFVRDSWHAVPPMPDALIINLGDVIQVWSNDRYKSPVHRVRAQSNATRVSVPFFFTAFGSARWSPGCVPGRARPIWT